MIQGNRGNRQAGAVVGLHYHLHQADYWYVPMGRARVVLHDLREGSPTDGKTLTIDLGERPDGTFDHRGVFIPPGVAHGFAALTDMDDHLSGRRVLQPERRARRRVERSRDRGRLGRDRPDALAARSAEPGASTHWTSRCDHAGDCGREYAAHPRHRRGRVHRVQLRASRPRAHRRLRHRLRRPHVRRQPLDTARRRRRPEVPVREGQHLRSRVTRGRDARARRRRPLRRREPCRPFDRGSGRLHPHELLRHEHGHGRCPAPRDPTCGAHRHRRGLRLGRDRFVEGDRSTGTSIALLGVQGGLRSHRARRTTTPTGCRCR